MRENAAKLFSLELQLEEHEKWGLRWQWILLVYESLLRERCYEQKCFECLARLVVRGLKLNADNTLDVQSFFSVRWDWESDAFDWKQSTRSFLSMKMAGCLHLFCEFGDLTYTFHPLLVHISRLPKRVQHDNGLQDQRMALIARDMKDRFFKDLHGEKIGRRSWFLH